MIKVLLLKIAGIFFPVILCLSCTMSDTPHYTAVKGVMDLRSCGDLTRKVISLDGEWEFYWKELLDPDEINKIPGSRAHNFAEVPSVWRNLKDSGYETDSKGYATYRVRLLVPEGEKLYAIHLFSLISAYKIWVDGKLLGETGRVGVSDETMDHKWIPGEYYFMSSSGVVDIVIQISNFRCDLGGFWTPAKFGYADIISSYLGVKISFDNLMLGLLLMIAFYNIVFHIFQVKEKSSLWFGLFCLVIAVRILSLGEQRMLYQVPGLPWDCAYRIEMLSFYIAGGVFYFFLRALYPDESSHVIVRITVIITAATIGIAALLPVLWLGRISSFYLFTTVFYFAAGLVVVTKALVNRKSDAAIFMAGIIALIISAFNDMLNLLGIIHNGFHVPSGFMVFVLAQSFIMLRRFSMSFVRAERLAQELEIINLTLEQKVDERTSELENEKNILRDQTTVMDNELKIARSIQRGIIPVKAPFENMAFYYRPMSRVGGDFFDFIKMRENSIGIFISDVSGHGVPAALITSMLKSFVLQSGEKKQNPAELMTYLNDSLIDHTTGNFITAFYCIYNPSESSITYCNAGHPFPYVISGNGVEFLSSGNRNVPLAVFKSSELENYNKLYRNNAVSLKKGERLLLYTDGLIEARSGEYSKSMFGETDLEPVLFEYRNLPVKEFLSRINEKLIEYCQSEYLEDDICMVCIDL